MSFIDQIAYRSGLRTIDPVAKLLVALTVLFVGLLANSYLVSGMIVVVMGWVTVKHGGTPPKTLFRLLLLPLSFLLIAALTILIQKAEQAQHLIFSVKLFGRFYGFDETALGVAAKLILKAFGAISCMYFLALTTPMTELFCALRRLRLPKLMVELMELIYRFIFVLTDTANQIYIAQSSRSGYNGIRASYQSLGLLLSTVFIRAYKRSDRMYLALESRGYQGEFTTVGMDYVQPCKYYLYNGVFVVLLIFLALLEGMVLV